MMKSLSRRFEEREIANLGELADSVRKDVLVELAALHVSSALAVTEHLRGLTAYD